MLQNQIQCLKLAMLVAVPLVVVGCSGGGSGSSGPKATPTPIVLPPAGPTPTPAAVPATFSITANISQASGALPYGVRFTDGTADIFTQLGYNVVTARFGQDNTPGAQPAFYFTVSTLGTIKTGDSFALSRSSIGLGDKNLVFNDLRDPSTFKQYEAISGTFRVNSLTNNPATTTQKATTTVNFTLTNVILHDVNTVGSSDLTLNATGQFTATNLGAVPTPTSTPTPSATP